MILLNRKQSICNLIINFDNRDFMKLIIEGTTLYARYRYDYTRISIRKEMRFVGTEIDSRVINLNNSLMNLLNVCEFNKDSCWKIGDKTDNPKQILSEHSKYNYFRYAFLIHVLCVLNKYIGRHDLQITVIRLGCLWNLASINVSSFSCCVNDFTITPLESRPNISF